MTLIYDDECPVCRNFTRMIRIKETVGDLVLINAREEGDEVHRLTAAGFDLDDGMALIIDESIYYGADSMQMLALMGSRSGAFNRINHWIFRSPTRSRVLYPVLKAGRNLLLRILGRKKINNLNSSDDEEY